MNSLIENGFFLRKASGRNTIKKTKKKEKKKVTRVCQKF